MRTLRLSVFLLSSLTQGLYANQSCAHFLAISKTPLYWTARPGVKGIHLIFSGSSPLGVIAARLRLAYGRTGGKTPVLHTLRTMNHST